MAKEIWEDIKNYEGFYQVSNIGRIESLEREVWNGKVYYLTQEKILIHRLTKAGYCRVQLYKNGLSKDRYIHELVATHFLVNIDNYKEVNHKNGIKSDNRVENLEWCNRTQNGLHSYYVLKNNAGCIPKRSVKSTNLKNNKTIIFETIMSAERWLRKIGYSKALHGNISAVCRGRNKYAYGHTWEYIDEVTV